MLDAKFDSMFSVDVAVGGKVEEKNDSLLIRAYELTFTKYFFEPRKIRDIDTIAFDIKEVEMQMAEVL